MDNAGHHFRHVDLAQTLEEHHQRLGPGGIGVVVEKRLRVHALVVQVLKTLIALRYWVIDVGRGRMFARDFLTGRGGRSIQATGRGQAIV
jgi:hypothetical protein